MFALLIFQKKKYACESLTSVCIFPVFLPKEKQICERSSSVYMPLVVIEIRIKFLVSCLIYEVKVRM